MKELELVCEEFMERWDTKPTGTPGRIPHGVHDIPLHHMPWFLNNTQLRHVGTKLVQMLMERKEGVLPPHHGVKLMQKVADIAITLFEEHGHGCAFLHCERTPIRPAKEHVVDVAVHLRIPSQVLRRALAEENWCTFPNLTEKLQQGVPQHIVDFADLYGLSLLHPHMSYRVSVSTTEV